jgi:hypothetical protein
MGIRIPIPGFLRDPRLWRGPFPLFLAFLAAINAVVFLWNGALVRQRQENLLAAAPKPASATEGPVRWDRSIGERTGEYLPLIPDARRNRVAIVSGMSQMYAINDPEPGDRTVAEHLDDALSPRGIRAFGLAAPNMHNEEALLLLAATLADEKTHPAFFIYGVCFDKFRNVDLRPGFRRLLASDPRLARSWRETALRYRAQYPAAAEKMLADLPAAPSGEPGRATVEQRLRKGAAGAVPLVAARENLNAWLMMRLFMIRNRVLGITPQSKRPILKARYDLNREFLGMLADVASAHGVRPLFYVVPLNPQAENPYIPAQYADFKGWLSALCRAKGIPAANLESAVPAEHWGEFMGGPDFKHFRGAGHAITAKAILDAFGPDLNAGRGGR